VSSAMAEANDAVQRVIPRVQMSRGCATALASKGQAKVRSLSRSGSRSGCRRRGRDRNGRGWLCVTACFQLQSLNGCTENREGASPDGQ
jgi:hypothetical protein